VLKKATIRKEQEPDFEEKRFNVTIGEDEREFDKENDFFRERSYRIIREYDMLILNTSAETRTHKTHSVTDAKHQFHIELLQNLAGVTFPILPQCCSALPVPLVLPLHGLKHDPVFFLFQSVTHTHTHTHTHLSVRGFLKLNIQQHNQGCFINVRGLFFLIMC